MRLMQMLQWKNGKWIQKMSLIKNYFHMKNNNYNSKNKLINPNNNNNNNLKERRNKKKFTQTLLISMMQVNYIK